MLCEVRICSGQSNMEFTTEMLGGWENYESEKTDFEKYDLSNIRLCQIDCVTFPVPEDICSAKWFSTDMDISEVFSAVASYSGKELYKKLKVPIGLISSNWAALPLRHGQKNHICKTIRILATILLQ
jgi:sialate O-acetylesterase